MSSRELERTAGTASKFSSVPHLFKRLVQKRPISPVTGGSEQPAATEATDAGTTGANTQAESQRDIGTEFSATTEHAAPGSDNNVASSLSFASPIRYGPIVPTGRNYLEKYYMLTDVTVHPDKEKEVVQLPDEAYLRCSKSENVGTPCQGSLRFPTSLSCTSVGSLTECSIHPGGRFRFPMRLERIGALKEYHDKRLGGEGSEAKGVDVDWELVPKKESTPSSAEGAEGGVVTGN